MEEMLERCCGLDVHKDSITACIMVGHGKQRFKEIRTFPTFTSDIRALATWLRSHQIEFVAMESTGIYWKPVFNILEEGFDLYLVNAQHVKQVPGRKTDVKDSEWLCKLLKCGLLRKSFIPPKAIMRLRELTRYRQKLVRQLGSEKNRLIKALENANIKLSSVFSDVFGKTCWDIVSKIVAGETDLEKLTCNINKHVRASRNDIKKALDGSLESEDMKMLSMMMDHVRYLQKIIADVEMMIDRHLEPFQAEVKLLVTIPGVQKVGAAVIISEIGVNMDQFKGDSQLVAWAGLCPGNNESAGKIRSSRIRKGNTHLKTGLVQLAWASSRTKNTYLSSKYRALSRRKGNKKAIIAIARKLLVICYHMLKKKSSFLELGPLFLDSLESGRKAKYHLKRLQELGYEVEVREKHKEESEQMAV